LKLASRFAIPQLPLVVAYTEGFFYPHGVAFGVTVELMKRRAPAIGREALAGNFQGGAGKFIWRAARRETPVLSGWMEF